MPFAFLEVLACDCEITRIVLDADGVPLDVGQTQRSYSKELRRAVLARDRHCRWPGCTMRASWCEVHHCTWYSRGGPTSLDNAVTLCVFHHHEVHRRDITIDVVSGGHRFIRTDGTTLGTSTRHADHLLVPSLLGSGQAGDVRGGGPPGRGSSTVGRQPKGGSSGTRGDPPERRSPP